MMHFNCGGHHTKVKKEKFLALVSSQELCELVSLNLWVSMGVVYSEWCFQKQYTDMIVQYSSGETLRELRLLFSLADTTHNQTVLTRCRSPKSPRVRGSELCKIIV